MQEGVGFVVEGFLVGADAQQIQLVMQPYLLEIDRRDVVHIEELPPIPLQDTAVCVAVRLHVQRGARVLGMRSAREIEARMWASRRPFAMQTRPEQAPIVGETAYAERERTFFSALGLED
ncbi:MAG TPA: hypothetical protein VMH32_23925 [Burkholderiales bacterium]|nr:hypothetical protein [Burkholderiales bacterium]